MRDDQWDAMLRLFRGESIVPEPVGLIIDCPWLPGWFGTTILEYLTDDETWLAANLKVMQEFPHVWFLPGFWAEYGMCTEPSAFGVRCRFHENDFPHAERVLLSWPEADRITVPNCRTDGLLPLVIKRLKHCQARMEASGHRIRFAVSRGPMNIASYLLGQTEFLLGLRSEPERALRLLDKVSRFIVDWLRYQKECFPSIEGVLVLDDLIGFVGPKDFETFACPFMRQVFGALDVPVRMLHNDAHGLITAKYAGQIGFNAFNFSHEHGLAEIRALAGEDVVLVGNIPPRDVLAGGTPEDVARAVDAAKASLTDRRRLIWSAGGGTPPGVTSENLRAFCEAVTACS
ncbi:uroporphyrinogen decarboxylase family protein [Thermopirellula anaerolimosa]